MKTTTENISPKRFKKKFTWQIPSLAQLTRRFSVVENKSNKEPSFYFFSSLSSLNTFLWVALLLVMLLFFLNSRRGNIPEHQNYLHTLTLLQHENIVLDKSILQTCQSYHYSFDGVFAHIKELQNSTQNLVPPPFLSIAATTTLEEKRLFYLTILEKNKKIVQRLKKARTLMGSSLDALSVEVLRCNTMLLKEKKMEKLKEIQTLFHSILLYNTPLQQTIYANIDQKIKKLKNIDNTFFANKKELENYWKIIRLAQNIVTARAEIDLFLQALSELSEISTLQEMHDIYMVEHKKMIKKKFLYRTLFHLSILLHILFSAAMVFFLYKKKIMVKNIKQNMEALVEERVADLTQRHEELNNYINELCNAQERFEKASVIDELTGLYTRRFLFEWLQKQMSLIARTPGSFCCMMVDIDHLKQINEEYGYVTGDEILKKVAMILKEQVREDDIVCRYGGEEFLVFLSQSEFELARPVAERIRQSIAKNLIEPAPVTVSVGLAACQCKAEYKGELDFRTIMSDLIEQADLALFEAKKNGRNRIEVSADAIELV